MGLPASRVEEPARLGIRDVLAGAFAQADHQIGYTNVHFADCAISAPVERVDSGHDSVPFPVPSRASANGTERHQTEPDHRIRQCSREQTAIDRSRRNQTDPEKPVLNPAVGFTPYRGFESRSLRA